VPSWATQVTAQADPVPTAVAPIQSAGIPAHTAPNTLSTMIDQYGFPVVAYRDSHGNAAPAEFAGQVEVPNNQSQTAEDKLFADPSMQALLTAYQIANPTHGPITDTILTQIANYLDAVLPPYSDGKTWANSKDQLKTLLQEHTQYLEATPLTALVAGNGCSYNPATNNFIGDGCVQTSYAVDGQSINVTEESFITPKSVAKFSLTAAASEAMVWATAGVKVGMASVLDTIEEFIMQTAIKKNVSKAVWDVIVHPAYWKIVRPKILRRMGPGVVASAYVAAGQAYADHLYKETTPQIAEGLCSANPDSPLCH
jgi:hypothetical protein